MTRKSFLWLGLWLCCLTAGVKAQQLERISPGQEWPDNKGEHINAHGGGLLFDGGKYYWYGENRPARGFTTEVGVEVYSSTDLMNWTDEGVALAVSEEAGSPIERGCIMERPKVVRNPKTGKYVMLFHLELKGQGYAAARVGFAESDSPTGPFRFIRSLRPNAGVWPADFSRKDIREAKALKEEDYKEWWTPAWREAVTKGLLLARDVPGGQMSRDMTVFVDDDGKAYHIYSAEENLTLNLAELTDDYLDYTGKYVRIAPADRTRRPPSSSATAHTGSSRAAARDGHRTRHGCSRPNPCGDRGSSCPRPSWGRMRTSHSTRKAPIYLRWKERTTATYSWPTAGIHAA